MSDRSLDTLERHAIEQRDMYRNEAMRVVVTEVLGLIAAARELERLKAEVAELRVEIAAAWQSLGTTEVECADDPDTARLCDSIRASLNYWLQELGEARSELHAARERIGEAKQLIQRARNVLIARPCHNRGTWVWIGADGDECYYCDEHKDHAHEEAGWADPLRRALALLGTHGEEG